MWNRKINDTNELMYKTETQLTVLENKCLVAGGKG